MVGKNGRSSASGRLAASLAVAFLALCCLSVAGCGCSGGAGDGVADADPSAAASPKAANASDALPSATETADLTAQGAGAATEGPSSGSAPGNGGGSSSQGGEAGHVHAWATRYVVDSAAWTEEVYHPMEGEQHDEVYVQCTVCGADCSADPGGHIISAHSGHGSWTTATRTITTIYQEAYTEYIEHSESGHTEVYCTGCGAVQ